MNHSTTTPTKDEAAWMAAVADFGCIVCWLFHQVKTPCAVHHLKSGGIRIGHKFTIGLCDPGHHNYASLQPGSGKIAVHENPARFKRAYGTELELLEKSRELIGVPA